MPPYKYVLPNKYGGCAAEEDDVSRKYEGRYAVIASDGVYRPVVAGTLDLIRFR